MHLDTRRVFRGFTQGCYSMMARDVSPNSPSCSCVSDADMRKPTEEGLIEALRYVLLISLKA